MVIRVRIVARCRRRQVEDGRRVQRVAIPLFLRNVFTDREAQERIIASSGLDWVIVRPAALTNGPSRNVFRAGSDVGNWFVPSRISRADVAMFMLGQLTGGEYLRRTPGLAY